MFSRIWRFTGLSESPLWSPIHLRSFSSCPNNQAGSTLYQKLRAYPDLLAMYKKSSGLSKELYAEVRKNPELMHALRVSSQLYEKKISQEMPKLHEIKKEKRRERNRLFHYSHKNDDFYNRRKMLYFWCFGQTARRHPWIREQLQWKTHRPLFSVEPIEHQCMSCLGWRRGMKSWWQDLRDPEKFVEHSCHMKAGWHEVMPEGYEDIRTLKDLIVRRKRLSMDQSADSSHT